MRIQIFLASSITEFEIDRLKVVDFVNRLNKIYHKEKSDPIYDESRDLFFFLEKCEDDDDLMERGAKQERYDRQILESDFVYFLFGEKLGVYTKHEFDLAYKAFKESEKPKIYIYARVTADNGEPIVRDASAKDFDSLLRKNIAHYYGKYTHIDTLLYKMAMNIIAMDYPSINVSVKNDSIVDGIETILSLKNVPAWSANDALLQAQTDFEQLEKDYYRLRIEYDKEDCEEATLKRYHEIAEEYDKKRKSIRELKAQIFEDLKKLTVEISKPGLSSRLIAAYGLMDEGQYVAAKELLKLEDIKSDIADDEIFDAQTSALQTVVDDREKRSEYNRRNRLNELIAGIKTSTAMARTPKDFDEIDGYFKTACDFVKKHSDLPREVIFDYAVFLHEIRNITDALNFVEIYLAGNQSLRKRLEALSFALTWSSRLESAKDKILGYWRDAIDGWHKLFGAEKYIRIEDLQEVKGYHKITALIDRPILLKFQEFLRNSGDFILGNKFYAGQDDLINREGVLSYFLKLHKLCESVVKTKKIPLFVPENLDSDYKNYISDRIFASEQKPLPITDSDNQVLVSEMGGSCPKRPKFAVMESVTSFGQAEELFAYAFSITKAILDEKSDDETLMQFAENASVVAALNMNIVPISSYELLLFAYKTLEKLSDKDNNRIKLEMAICKQNMAQALLSQDLKSKKETNLHQVEGLHASATKEIIELFETNPRIFYVNLVQAYLLEAHRCRHYANMHDRIVREESVFLIEAVKILDNIVLAEGNLHFVLERGDLSSGRAYVEILSRIIQISYSVLEGQSFFDSVSHNFKSLVSKCFAFVEKYPETFRVHLYDACMNFAGFLLFEKGEIKYGLEVISEACDCFVEMIKCDDRDIFSAADGFFGQFFNGISPLYQDAEIKEAAIKIELNTLKKIMRIYEKTPAVMVIPKRERHHRYHTDFAVLTGSQITAEQNSHDIEFLEGFSTILFRAFSRYTDIMKEMGEMDEFCATAKNILALYLELQNHGVEGYWCDAQVSEKGKRRNDGLSKQKNIHTTIQQNILSIKILNREYFEIRQKLMETEDGENLVAGAFIKDIERIVTKYAQHFERGFRLSDNYKEQILNKCESLETTIGRAYLKTNSAETQVTFDKAMDMQDKLASLDSSFMPVLSEYYMRKMQKQMAKKEKNRADELSLWVSILEYFILCERHSICSNSLKDVLIGFGAMKKEDKEQMVDYENCRNAVRNIMALANKKIEQFSGE